MPDDETQPGMSDEQADAVLRLAAIAQLVPAFEAQLLQELFRKATAGGA